MSKKDFYELLGVSKTATDDDLKKAYRKLAMKYHPDRNPGDKKAEDKFRDISEAYDVLKDPQKRAAYDRFGHGAFDGGHPGGGAGFGAGFGGGFSGNFSDIIEEMFTGFSQSQGGGGPAHHNLQGADIRYNLEITLEDAYAGSIDHLRFTTFAECDSCKSTGSASRADPMTCSACRGRGRVRAQQGFFTVERTCSACDGMGQKIKDPCKTCHGEGRARKEKTLEVKIPAGVDDGTRIRIANAGEAGIRGGVAGDLYVFISIKSHKFFKRDQNNLHCRVPICMTTAALGGEIDVPNIEGGRSKLKVPAGTQSGSQFRLKGKGMPLLRSTIRGDMYVEIAVETPVNLTKNQRELLEEFDRISKGESTSPEASGFLHKLKELWSDIGGTKS